METLSLRDVDMDRSSSPSQVPDSSQPVPPTDLVKWQSTQPLPALGALLRDPVTSRPPRRISHSTGQPTLFFDELSSPDTKPSKSASTNTMNRKVASRRAHPRHSDSALPPTRAASPFSLSRPFSSDEGHSSFVDILKSVSKMVDENAKIKKQRLEKKRNRTRRSNVSENMNKAREELINKTNVGPAKIGGSRKGKERVKDSFNTDADPNHSSFAMDVDTPIPQTPPSQSLPVLGSSASRMPPPPLPSKVMNPPTRSHTSTRSRSSPPRDVRRPPSPSPTSAHASVPPTPSFSRPPALGMRRIANPTNSNTHNEKVPFSTQKSFKPPLAKSSTPDVLVPNTSTISHHSFATSTKKESVVDESASHSDSERLRSQTSLPTPDTTPVTVTSPKFSLAPSVVVSDDTDSSFGELSFDLDILEEVMKEYD